MKLIHPMLAEKGEKELLKSKEYWFEPKLDGTRAIAYVFNGKVKLINRRERDIASRYPEITEAMRTFSEGIYDGEIVVFVKGMPSFKHLQMREHADGSLAKLKAKLYPATYVIFDRLYVGGESIMHEPIETRREFLDFEENERVKKIFFTEDGEKLWKMYVEKLGGEGIMAKRKGSIYEEKRSFLWRKIKKHKEVDAVVIGYTQEKRKISALLLALYDKGKLRYIGKVGTGFSEEEIEEMLKKFEKIKTEKYLEVPIKEAIFVKPLYVVSVRYLETTEDNELRAPVFLRFREDKKPEDCEFSQLF